MLSGYLTSSSGINHGLNEHEYLGQYGPCAISSDIMRNCYPESVVNFNDKQLSYNVNEDGRPMNGSTDTGDKINPLATEAEGWNDIWNLIIQGVKTTFESFIISYKSFHPIWNHFHYYHWEKRSCTVEVWEWIRNFTPHFTKHWLLIHAGIKVKPS